MSDKKINILKLAGSCGIINGKSIYSNPELAKSWFMKYSMELCEKALELAAENVSIKYEEIEQGENQYVWLRDYPEVNKKSITDTINQVE